MNVLILTDAYFPNNSSVSVLLSDLAQALMAQSVQVSILVSVSDQDIPLKVWQHEGCEVISVKALKTKDISYIRRTINEFLNPWFMWRILENSLVFQGKKYDGIIWYSPTIFWGPLIKKLKNKFRCKSYLILRDIFPDWALHVGILKKGLPYWFFKGIEQYQYRQADCIGVQSPNNLKYFQQHNPDASARAQVLWNWASKPSTLSQKDCPINISNTSLRGKIVFVYAGNLGVAQGGGTALFELANDLQSNSNIGILVVGRGSAIDSLRNKIASASLNNILVFDEIDSADMPALLKQCHVGLVFLDPRHQTHNIPGKFLSYLQSGLPTLAWMNAGNDLIDVINKHGLGCAYSGTDAHQFANMARQLADSLKISNFIFANDGQSIENLFLSKNAAQQILISLKECE